MQTGRNTSVRYKTELSQTFHDVTKETDKNYKAPIAMIIRMTPPCSKAILIDLDYVYVTPNLT